MPYVMVPVPAEHEREFQQFIMTTILRDAMNQWSAEGLGAILDQLTPDQVRLVDHLADRSVNGSAPTKQMVAAALDLPEERVISLHQEVNDLCAAADKPQLILFDAFPTFDGDGASSVPNLLAVPRNAAELILQRHG